MPPWARIFVQMEKRKGGIQERADRRNQLAQEDNSNKYIFIIYMCFSGTFFTFGMTRRRACENRVKLNLLKGMMPEVAASSCFKLFQNWTLFQHLNSDNFDIKLNNKMMYWQNREFCLATLLQ